MRPVNLIPPEERIGERSAARTGPVAYLVVGALVLALLGVAASVLTDNQISDRESESLVLKGQVTAAQARADSLAAYTAFHAVREARSATISGLAESRFDWQRVIRELSLVIPQDVWLTNLTGTVSPAVQVVDDAAVVGRETVAGPALELSGCAPGQEAVARFVTVLRDIEGVTRVAVPKSSLPGSSSEGSSSSCQTRNFIAEFQIVVAFDAAPVPAIAAPDAGIPAPAPTPATDAAATSATTSDPASGGDTSSTGG